CPKKGARRVRPICLHVVSKKVQTCHAANESHGELQASSLSISFRGMRYYFTSPPIDATIEPYGALLMMVSADVGTKADGQVPSSTAIVKWIKSSVNSNLSISTWTTLPSCPCSQVIG